MNGCTEYWAFLIVVTSWYTDIVLHNLGSSTILVSGFGWIHTEVCVAEREGESSLNSTISTNLFFHLYPTLTTEDFPEYVRDERYSLKQESDT